MIWFSGTLPITLSPKWTWHNDASIRTSFETTPQIIIRTGIVYKLSKTIKIATGYALSFARNYSNSINKEYGTENRIWQEFVMQNVVTHFLTLRNRIRTEQRFFEEITTKTKFNALRYRYKIDGIFSLNKKLQLLIFNEFMLQHSNAKTNFDQNRAQLAVVYKCINNVQLQTAIMALKRPNHITQKIIVFTFSKQIQW